MTTRLVKTDYHYGVSGVPAYINGRVLTLLATVINHGEHYELLADRDYHGPFLIAGSETRDPPVMLPTWAQRRAMKPIEPIVLARHASRTPLKTTQILKPALVRHRSQLTLVRVKSK